MFNIHICICIDIPKKSAHKEFLDIHIRMIDRNLPSTDGQRASKKIYDLRLLRPYAYSVIILAPIIIIHTYKKITKNVNNNAKLLIIYVLHIFQVLLYMNILCISTILPFLFFLHTFFRSETQGQGDLSKTFKIPSLFAMLVAEVVLNNTLSLPRSP